MEEYLIEIVVDSPAEATMGLLSLSSPDTYDLLQIFPQQTGSQEIKTLMVQSTTGPFLSRDDLSTC